MSGGCSPIQKYASLLIHSSRFVKVLVIEIFSSVLGLFGLIIGLLVSGKAGDFKSTSMAV